MAKSLMPVGQGFREPDTQHPRIDPTRINQLHAEKVKQFQVTVFGPTPGHAQFSPAKTDNVLKAKTYPK